jgi:parvulin-like peptidyl-prolyl isomerase
MLNISSLTPYTRNQTPDSQDTERSEPPIPETRNQTPQLQIGDICLTPEELIPLISKYRLVPQLAKEILIEAAIEDYDISETEYFEAYQKFYQQQQLKTDRDLELWLQHQKLIRDDLVHLINRELRLQKFKDDKWQTKVESHFCQRKFQLDRVIFSMIRLKEIDIAEEIYFRLVSKEETFYDLAPRYSIGIEAKTKGISGPIELGKLDPILANALITSQPEEVLPPLQLKGWWVVVQLEALLPAQFDDEMRQILTEELFTQWVGEEVAKLLE